MSRNKPSSSTWAAMRTSPSSQQPAGTNDGPAPLFWKPRGQHVSKPPPETDAFPSLMGNSTSRQQEPALSQQVVGGAGAGPRSSAPATEGLGRRRSLSAPSLPSVTLLQPYSAIAGSSSNSKKPAGHSRRSSSVDRSQPMQQHGQHNIHNTQLSHQPTPQQQPLPQQLQQEADTGLQLLQECHPWCEAVMLHEVLQAVGGDVAAALEALQQMLPVPAADGQNTPDPASSCSDGSCSDTSIEQARGVTTSSSKAANSGLRQNWPAGPTDQPDQAVEDAAARLHQLRVHDNSSQQQQQLGQVPGVEDTYRVIRGDAVKLSHKYRKASKRAAAARSQGDFSAAAQLAAEALSIKAAADAAHAAAALKIEVANNAQTPFGLWELDLHGLHVTEALHAFEERVQLLTDISQDLKKQSAMQPAALAAGGAGLPAAGNTKQNVLTSLLLPGGDVSWGQQLAAMRQELRVIVGKGLHSSGGEASLPRVVEQWLLQRGYKYVWREGFINVQLRLL